MVESIRKLTIVLTEVEAILISDWLASVDSSEAVARGGIPVRDAVDKFAIDQLIDRLSDNPIIYRGIWEPKLVAARLEAGRMIEAQLRELLRDLHDQIACPETRDSSAMQLAAYDDPRALDALLRVAAGDEDAWLHTQATESIAQIAYRKGLDSHALAAGMTPSARTHFLHFLEALVTADDGS